MHLKTYAFACLMAYACGAQYPGGRMLMTDRQQWLGPGKWALLPDAQRTASALVINQGAPRRVPILEGATHNMVFKGDKVYAVSVSPDGEGKNEAFLQILDLEAPQPVWSKIARIPLTQPGFPYSLVPLESEGYFLGYNNLEGFLDSGKASWLAVYRIVEGELTFVRLVEFPYGKVPNLCRIQEVTPGKDHPAVKAAVARHPMFAPSNTEPWISGDHIIFAASQLGILWIFNRSDGTFHRHVDFGHMDPNDLGFRYILDQFILAAQPASDGRLLVATRRMEVLEMALKLGRASKGLSKAQIKKEFITLYGDDRGIEWWWVDPRKGRVSRYDGNLNLPDLGASHRALGRFRFLVDELDQVHAATPDGRIPWADALYERADKTKLQAPLPIVSR